jgi:hypothetical protein
VGGHVDSSRASWCCFSSLPLEQLLIGCSIGKSNNRGPAAAERIRISGPAAFQPCNCHLVLARTWTGHKCALTAQSHDPRMTPIIIIIIIIIDPTDSAMSVSRRCTVHLIRSPACPCHRYDTPIVYLSTIDR